MKTSDVKSNVNVHSYIYVSQYVIIKIKWNNRNFTWINENKSISTVYF